MTELLPSLFRHESRPDWGLATIAWERDGKRAYLFETGMLRVLAEPFYRFMVPVDSTKEKDLAILDRLMTQVDSRDAQMVSPRASLPPGTHFGINEQLLVFREAHPNGFDATWQSSVRGEGAARRLKRHRNPGIVDMQAQINAASLEKALAASAFPDVWLAIADVLEATDLVPAAPITQLRKASRRATATTVNALGKVLFGAGEFPDRFDSYVTALQRMLGRAPSWELATAVLALSDPREYVCVRRSSLQQQADWIMPELRAGAKPNALTYGGFMSLAKVVCQQLESCGMTPQDYFDVYDFVKTTTAPRAIERMATQRALNPPPSVTNPAGPSLTPPGPARAA